MRTYLLLHLLVTMLPSAYTSTVWSDAEKDCISVCEESIWVGFSAYGLPTNPLEYFSKFITERNSVLEKHYELTESNENILAPTKHSLQLLNGIFLDFKLLSDTTLKLVMSYKAAENYLHKIPVVPISSSRPIRDANLTEHETFSFYLKETNTELVLFNECGILQQPIYQDRYRGTMPGPVGNVLIFSQNNCIYILKKLGPDAVLVLVLDEAFSTAAFPVANFKKIAKQAAAAYHNLCIQQIFLFFVFCGCLAVVIKFVKLRVARRKKNCYRKQSKLKDLHNSTLASKI